MSSSAQQNRDDPVGSWPAMRHETCLKGKSTNMEGGAVSSRQIDDDTKGRGPGRELLDSTKSGTKWKGKRGESGDTSSRRVAVASLAFGRLSFVPPARACFEIPTGSSRQSISVRIIYLGRY